MDDQPAVELVEVQVEAQVIENRPPDLSAPDEHLSVGEERTVVLSPYDPDGDELTLRVEGLPPGATFDAHYREIHWTPTRADIGEHRFVIALSDGTHEESYPARLQVEEGSWGSWLSLGVGYGGMALGEPVAGPAPLRGVPWYSGPLFDLEIFRSGAPDPYSGPSRTRIYTNVGLLRGPGGEKLLRYGAGVDLSLERRAARRWLIPLSGIEIMSVRAPERDALARVSPHFGLWLYNGEQVSIQAACGYGYALTEPTAASGVDCSAAVHASSW